MSSKTRSILIICLCLLGVLVTIWLVGRDGSTDDKHPSIGLNTTWPVATITPLETRRVDQKTETVEDHPSPVNDEAQPQLTAQPMGEYKVVEMALQPFQGRYRTTTDECGEAVENEGWTYCIAPANVQPVSFDQWEVLFPGANFFVVKLVERNMDPQYSGQTYWRLGAWYDDQLYNAGSFDRLLTAFGVVISDSNREQVAQAFALMTIPKYLSEEVVFTEWEAGDWSGRHNYTHYLFAWTKLHGLRVLWWFEFGDNQLRYASVGGVAEVHVGDYVGNVDPDNTQLPAFQDFSFVGR